MVNRRTTMQKPGLKLLMVMVVGVPVRGRRRLLTSDTLPGGKVMLSAPAKVVAVPSALVTVRSQAAGRRSSTSKLAVSV